MENNKIKLDFLKRVLTDTVYNDEVRNSFFDTKEFPGVDVMNSIINSSVEEKRMGGMDWPERAHTMVGVKRLNNLHETLDYIRKNNIDGDFIETGVWRGGASIFIKLYNDLYSLNRNVFVADSFAGLPPPDSDKYPVDEGDIHHTIPYLSVSLDQVTENFKLYNALDESVIFLKGWFSDTLKNNDNIKNLALLRFDGDMYGSTMDVFENLYHKVNSKGVIIVDDYCLPNCVKAVTDFRQKNNITNEIKTVDSCGVYWIKD
jgi:O-methyltransferase